MLLHAGCLIAIEVGGEGSKARPLSRTRQATSVVATSLLRHANPTTTLAIYAQGIDANRLAAQGAMMRAVLHPVSDVVQ